MTTAVDQTKRPKLDFKAMIGKLDKDEAFSLNEIVAGGTPFPFRVKKVKHLSLKTQHDWNVGDVFTVDGYYSAKNECYSTTEPTSYGGIYYTCGMAKQWQLVK